MRGEGRGKEGDEKVGSEEGKRGVRKMDVGGNTRDVIDRIRVKGWGRWWFTVSCS